MLEETPHADCRVTADGVLTLDLALPPLTAPPSLELRLRTKDGEPTRHALPVESAGADGRWRAVLGAEPVLAEGRWDLYLRVASDGEWRRVAPGVRDLRALLDQEPAAVDGPLAVRVPYRTKDGWFAVRAWLRPALAEAGPITVSPEGSMTVRARLVGAELRRGAAAVVKLRGGGKKGPVRKAELRDEGAGAFSFTVPYAELLGVAAEGQTAFWDVTVRPATKAPRVRVARLLDDIADKKAVFVYPASKLAEATVQPYYTVDNDLAIRVDYERA
ncbi:hypothetical protein E1265_14105 [Streptomyces sp. 8K308]|nr:hypothetical protein E1265_14105 [Streptomyces sp. 8K308]